MERGSVHWGLVVWHLVFPANLLVPFETQWSASSESKQQAGLRRMLRSFSTVIHAGIASLFAAVILLLAAPLGAGTQREELFAILERIVLWITMFAAGVVALGVLLHTMTTSSRKNSSIWWLILMLYASAIAFTAVGTWLGVSVVLRVVYPTGHAFNAATQRGIVTSGVMMYFVLHVAFGCSGLLIIGREAVAAAKNV